MKTLYKITAAKEFPDARWATAMNIRHAMGFRELVLELMDLFGNGILAENVSLHDLQPLSSVGSFETKTEMLDLITPFLVEEARAKIQSIRGYNRRVRANIALDRQPWTNACWVLKATPEELQSWADTLAS